MIIEKGDWQLEIAAYRRGIRFGVEAAYVPITAYNKIWHFCLSFWWSFYISLEWFHYDAG